MKLVEVELQLKMKLKVAIMIPPTLWPTAAWGSQRWTVLHLKHGKVFCWEFWWTGVQSGAGQAREPRPGLGFLPWLVTQKYLSKPLWWPVVSVGAAQSTAQYSPPWEPQAAVGLRVGKIIMATFSFSFSWSSTSKSFVMKCLRYFLL